MDQQRVAHKAEERRVQLLYFIRKYMVLYMRIVVQWSHPDWRCLCPTFQKRLMTNHVKYNMFTLKRQALQKCSP